MSASLVLQAGCASFIGRGLCRDCATLRGKQYAGAWRAFSTILHVIALDSACLEKEDRRNATFPEVPWVLDAGNMVNLLAGLHPLFVRESADQGT